MLSERNGLTTFRRCNRRGEVGGVSSPVARRLRARSSEPRSLATYRFGPSLSASWACSGVTAFIDTSRYIHLVPAPGPRPRWGWQSSRRLARSRPFPWEGGYVVPGASDPSVTRDAGPGRRLLAEQQV